MQGTQSYSRTHSRLLILYLQRTLCGNQYNYNWKEYLGYDVKEIANRLHLSDRQVRYLLQKAETIRVKYINA